MYCRSYRKLGEDHYRHATNYFYLAAKDNEIDMFITDELKDFMKAQSKRRNRRDPFAGMLRSRR